MRSVPPLGLTAAASVPPLDASAVTVEEYRGGLAPLAASWEALVEQSHPGAVFRSYAWLSAWWNCFSTGREALVLVARSGEQVVGLLPLYRQCTASAYAR